MPEPTESPAAQSQDARHPADAPKHEYGGIGFALFLVLAGIALLAERLGWLPNGSDWLFPIILIAWGAGELYHRLGAR